MNSFVTTTAYASEADGAVDAVDKMSKAIIEYGPLVVLLSIFFLIFIILIVVVLRSNHRLTTQIMNRNNTNGKLEEEVIKKFVNGALSELTKDQDIEGAIARQLKPLEDAISHMNHEHDDENDYHRDLVGAYIDVNMAFKDASRTALKDLKCDRIGIYIFHNGNESMLGLPFFKMSCIHEWTSTGTNTLRGKSHSSMPLHLFNDFIEDLWRDGVYKSENIDETIKTDPSIKEFISFSKTKSLYIMAIKNDSDAITGFVVAEFDNIETFEHNETRDSEINIILVEMIRKISPIVSNRYVFKKDK